MRLRGADRIRTGARIHSGRTSTTSTEILYFIEADDGPIKIGVSADPYMRLNSLQAANAHEVHILGIFEVPKGHEKWLHERLSQHRIRGEWFEPHADVFEALEACAFVAAEPAVAATLHFPVPRDAA